MTDVPRYECALITGASAGLGEEFAVQLAPWCRRMILVARREGRLKDLEERLRAANPALEVGSLAVDLTDERQREGMIGRFAGTEWAPSLLVNNAGMGDRGEFVTASWEKLDRVMKLNVSALTHLTHGFLPGMLAAGRGAILNVSSLAGGLPLPEFGVYAATKAYVTSFSEALRMEVHRQGISVLAVCPGPVPTEFAEVASRPGEMEPAIDSMRNWLEVDKEQVVEESLAALDADRARIYPGWKVALVAAGIALLPVALVRLTMGSRRLHVEEA